MSSPADPAHRWLFRAPPRPHASLRLYCFPSAGAAGTVYGKWPEHLPDCIDIATIQMPGRGPRIAEPLLKRMEPLVEAICSALQSEWEQGPFTLYGHSLGALTAFEVARHLRRTGGPQPEMLFLSGRQAPQFTGEPFLVSGAPDEELWDQLRNYNGTPDKLMQDPEVRRYFAPIFRADFEIIETYQYQPEPPLAIPFRISLGENDPSTPPGSELGWQEQTTASCVIRHYEGEHFFIQSHPDLFLAEFAADLEELVHTLSARGASESA